MELKPKTKLTKLTIKYPEIINFLAGYRPEFKKLKNPLIRNTIARSATLKDIADIGNIPIEKLITDLKQQLSKMKPVSNQRDMSEISRKRLQTLKDIIRDIHSGADPTDVSKRFADLLRDVDPTEITELEQTLINEGLPETEIQKLCDVHATLFKESLDEQEELDVPEGHPLHTFITENKALEKTVSDFISNLDRLDSPSEIHAPRWMQEELLHHLERISQVEKHYLRKEHQLFPFLEKRGISGPPQVMWGIHDTVRALIKSTRKAIENIQKEKIMSDGKELARIVKEMIYKENKILFPMALKMLDQSEWIEIKKGESEIGYCLISPPPLWPSECEEDNQVTPGKIVSGETLNLTTGNLNKEQLNLMIQHIPFDITFVDENDEVRFYSEGNKRIFLRTPDVIGRKVQNCHPPKSVNTVNKILKAFRDGTQNVAEFWIETEGRFIYIRYFPVRDKNGAYMGTLEITQDITEIRKLSGERRLLNWDEENQS